MEGDHLQHLRGELAADLLEALRTTLRLDPTYVPAYHELAGYYLNGGSYNGWTAMSFTAPFGGCPAGK